MHEAADEDGPRAPHRLRHRFAELPLRDQGLGQHTRKRASTRYTHTRLLTFSVTSHLGANIIKAQNGSTAKLTSVKICPHAAARAVTRRSARVDRNRQERGSRRSGRHADARQHLLRKGGQLGGRKLEGLEPRRSCG